MVQPDDTDGWEKEHSEPRAELLPDILHDSMRAAAGRRGNMPVLSSSLGRTGGRAAETQRAENQPEN